ncbi:hypothetical protein B0H63DRAFT_451882 [Podospora didyma]|uniref:Uncharacterized protein n=1 Tax=Podospora didyma TaxID=330526 RepID=A0AAE0KKD8_9PEZI|nr:hypothetical protein B0H63DRAFT_451882 [Podospora didyma]
MHAFLYRDNASGQGRMVRGSKVGGEFGGSILRDKAKSHHPQKNQAIGSYIIGVFISQAIMSSSSSMNKYWIPHLDIHKKVITQELQYYLGPQATEQIDDICVKSKEMWERQAAARGSGSGDKALKRPLHRPVVISKAGASDSPRRRSDDRWRNESRSRQSERRRA